MAMTNIEGGGGNMRFRNKDMAMVFVLATTSPVFSDLDNRYEEKSMQMRYD